MPGIAAAIGRRHRVLGPQLQLRHAALAERVHQRAPHDLVHQRLLAEPHLRLRRMHVDVERVGRHLDEQVHLGAALLDRRHAVGVDDRVRDRLVLDDAAVDEDVLRPARRPLLGQRRDVAGQPDAAGFLARPRSDRRARRTADRADRAATPPADTGAPCAPPLVSVKPISGYASASCVTMRETCADSAPSDFRNFRRAGRL